MAYGHIIVMDIVVMKYVCVRTHELMNDFTENTSAFLKVRKHTSCKLQILDFRKLGCRLV